eukprot:100876_1
MESSLISYKNAMKYLIYGYIRNIEHEWNKEKTIPDCVCQLCVLYYDNNPSIIICLYNHHSLKNIDIANIDMDQQSHSKYTIKQLNNQHNPSLLLSWNVNTQTCSAFCYHKNVSIPSQILNHESTQTQTSNIIFKCGKGSKYIQSTSCNAYFFNKPHHCQNNRNNNTIWHYDLPSLPQLLYRNSIVFDDKHGLISFGGEKESDRRHALSCVYRLPWISAGIDQINEWKWEKHSNLQSGRAQCMTALIKNKEIVLIIGGKSGMSYPSKSLRPIRRKTWEFTTYCYSMELYNLDDMESEELVCNKLNRKNGSYSAQNICARCYGGIYYEDKSENIYIGGGVGS